MTERVRDSLIGALAAAALALAATPAALAQGPEAPEPPPARPAPTLPEEAASLLRTLSDHAASRESREAAAERLIAMRDAPTLAALTAVLQGADEPRNGASTLLLNALARTATPASELFGPVVEYLRAVAGDRIPAALSAISSYRTPEAVEVILGYTATDRSAPVRSAAFRAMARLTGRDDLADDRARWLDWFERSRGLDRTEWNAVIAAGLARRADRLESARADATTRLADAFRRLYLVASGALSEDRTKILNSLLLDERDELRALGFEIVSRELSAGSAIDPSIGAAAVRLLGHGSAAVRLRAATLVNQLAPAGAAEAIGAALANEKDPAAAGAMLAAAARWPGEALRAPALRWVSEGGEARASAVTALLALARAGHLSAESDREPIRAVLGTIDPSRLTAQECRLLVAVGTDGERRRVAQVLSGENAATRLAAAESLVEHSEFLDRILEAAARDPAVFDTAVRGVIAHRRTATGFWALASLKGPSPEVRRSGLLRSAASVPVGELVAIARQLTEDMELRDAILARLAEPLALQAVEDPELVAAGLVLLAETRLALGRPDTALTALDALPPDAGTVDRAHLDTLRTMGLVWTNQLDKAAELDAPATAWLDALERALSEPHARAIVQAISARFDGRLAPDQTRRLDALVSRLKALDDSGPEARRNAEANGTSGPP